ncbi:hypothetical protein H5410_044666 [Solanum commersonii]|uniref:Small-subunit processome Utp12 domain-containing protein n=1 Tax=Solanum commersonii TaxID=4109 RepID=A0A9J5XBJ6_SOLCO|nr:hypothetical protein H5410_044666 [Solanum commersonii]
MESAYIKCGSKDNDVILWDVVGETGLFRLRGHCDQVHTIFKLAITYFRYDVVFLGSGKKLVTASKDKFLRSIDIDPEERYLVTGSADPELRFYTIKHDLADGQLIANKVNKDLPPENKWEVLKSFGVLQRQSKDRVATVRFNKSGSLLACQVAGKTVEIFCVLDESESKRKAKRRISRKEKKAAKEGREVTENGKTDIGAEGDSNLVVTVPDIFKLHQILQAGKKISSISFSPVTTKNSLATLVLSLNNNVLEFHAIESSSTTKLSAIELQGHRADVRSVTLSLDNTLLMSTSHNAIKIWNPRTGACLCTIDSGYGLCGLFVLGNKYAVVGTKGGTLEIIDIRSGTSVDVVEAHGDAVQSIALTPDGTGFLTGSRDHDVKFWEFQLVQKAGKEYKHLTASPVRNLKMNDDVLVIAASPDGKYVAVALLDNTVKVFYMDSLKFFLLLYGQKLPVFCMDISSDGDLLATGSADKNVKIWGLVFGDIDKSLFAHADSVMGVKFVCNTHYFFTVGKDRLVKYWDADKFELLLTLEGHHAEVWCLTISNRGDFLEEKEKRLEEMFESDIDNVFENKYGPKEEIPEEGAVALVGKKTQETLTATDSIIEALDMAVAELKRIAEHQEDKLKGKVSEFRPNILILGLSPSDYVLRALSSVRTNDLEQTLLDLPFSDALKLLSYLRSWASIPDKVELVCRVSTLLLQLHHHQLISTVSAKPLVIRLEDVLPPTVKQLKASKSDAISRDEKTKLLEICSHNAKCIEAREDTKQEKKRKKKQKKLDGGHVWS